MRGLSADDLIGLWERGQTLHPVDRALAILAAVMPDRPWQELAALGIGERDALLMRLHAQAFGRDLECYAECPSCAAVERVISPRKKAIRLSYLDYSTVDRRHALCAAEVRLNRRTAPMLVTAHARRYSRPLAFNAR